MAGESYCEALEGRELTLLRASNAALDCISSNSARAVELARNAANSFSDPAVGRMLVAMLVQLDVNTQAHISTVKECIESASSSIASSSASVASCMEEKQDMKEFIRSFQQKLDGLEVQLNQLCIDQLCKDHTDNRHRVLLQQLVHVIDEAALRHVFGVINGLRFQTVRDIQRASDAKRLEPDQEKRWREFCAVLNGMGCSVLDIVEMSRPLRRLCGVQAHVGDEEKQCVTHNDLLRWAAKFGINTEDTEALICVAMVFAEDGKPLLCSEDVSSIVEKKHPLVS